MRVKLGKRICFCTVATHTERSRLIILTTSNGVYTVDVGYDSLAEKCFDQLLLNGYYDFTYCEYSN